MIFSSVVASKINSGELNKKCDNDALKSAHAITTWSAVLSAISFLIILISLSYYIYSKYVPLSSPNILTGIALK